MPPLTRSLLGLSLAVCLVQCKPREVAPNNTLIVDSTNIVTTVATTVATTTPLTIPKKIYPNLENTIFFQGSLNNQYPIGLRIWECQTPTDKNTVSVSYYYHNSKKIIDFMGQLNADSLLVVQSISDETIKKDEKWTFKFLDNGQIEAIWEKGEKQMSCVLSPNQNSEPIDFQSFISNFKVLSLPFETKQLRSYIQKKPKEWTKIISPLDFAFTEELSTGLISLAIGKKFGIYKPEKTKANIHYGYKLNLPDQKIGLIMIESANTEYMPINCYVYDQTGKLLQQSELDYQKTEMGYRVADFRINADFTIEFEGLSEELEHGDVELEDENGEISTNSGTIETETLAPYKKTLKFKNNEFVSY